MQLKIFAIDAHGGEEAGEEMNRFLRSHRVVAVWAMLTRCLNAAHEPRQSQRDCVTKPRVGTVCLPWVVRAFPNLRNTPPRATPNLHLIPTPTGLCPWAAVSANANRNGMALVRVGTVDGGTEGNAGMGGCGTGGHAVTGCVGIGDHAGMGRDGIGGHAGMG